MKCRGKFKFKEIIKKDAGSFTNVQGQVINYDESYLLKLDEKTERGIQERSFKIPKDSPLIAGLQKYEEYTDIILDFDIQIFTNSIRIVPTGIATK